MNVQAIASSPGVLRSGCPCQSVVRGRNVIARTVEKQALPTRNVEAEPLVSDTPDKPQKYERAHGVLRLLAAGHFKPVPEQRLRANFADLLRDPDPDSSPGVDQNEVVPRDGADITFTTDAISPAEHERPGDEVGEPTTQVSWIA